METNKAEELKKAIDDLIVARIEASRFNPPLVEALSKAATQMSHLTNLLVRYVPDEN